MFNNHPAFYEILPNWSPVQARISVIMNPPRTIHQNLPPDKSREHFEALAESAHVRIERIVSYGQATRAGEWYDQERAEWVMVLSGQATLEYSDGRTVELASGDYLLLHPHEKHRVARTDAPTVWLAVHFD